MKKDRWAARIEDIEPGDRIEITCDRCNHESIVDGSVFVERMVADPKLAKWRDLRPFTPIKDLKYHVRCTRCPAPLNSKPHREYSIRILSAPRSPNAK